MNNVKMMAMGLKSFFEIFDFLEFNEYGEYSVNWKKLIKASIIIFLFVTFLLKVFLTLLFRQSKFMLIYLLDNKNMECVKKVYNNIKEILGIEKFKEIFEVVLTDNGSEFFNPMSIEKDEESGEIVSHVFYCDPNASWQKGAIEKNHEFIRYVLPKGSSFDELT